MPRTSRLLLEALRTQKREDRLTELLAVVLAGNSSFARRVLDEAGLPHDGEIEVSTQQRTRRGKYVDLQLLLLDATGHPLARLWSEHKTGSDYSAGQLAGYAEELVVLPVNGRLITIVNPNDRPGVPKGDWKVFTWRDVAVWAWSVGREAEGSAWRRTAGAATARADLRLLHELLSYLEEVHKAVLDPLSHLHIVAFARARNTHDVLTALMDGAGDRTTELDVSEDVNWGKEDHGMYWVTFKEEGTWAEPLEGHIELIVEDSDEWTYQRLGEPAFGTGFTLPEDVHERLSSTEMRPWREPLEDLGFTVRLFDGWARVYRTMYVAELAAKGATQDAQAQALAGFVEDAVRVLKAHDPNITRTPPPKRSRRKAAEASNAAPQPNAAEAPGADA